MIRPAILIVDDETGVRSSLEGILQDDGFETEARRRHEIFHQVVKVFVKKGFREASMHEIAQAAGLGKSTLYDYFKTKDEILIYFCADQLSDLTDEAQKIALQNLSADKRLRQIMGKYLESLQANKNLFLKLMQEAQCLKPEGQNWYRKNGTPTRTLSLR